MDRLPHTRSPAPDRAALSAAWAEASDSALLGAIASERDEAAFIELYRRYEAPLYNLAFRILCSRQDAEEAVQDALHQIWRRAEAFEPQGRTSGWINRILVRKCIRGLRRRRARQDLPFEHLDAVPVQTAQMRERQTVDSGEVQTVLTRLIDTLSPEDRRLLTLYYLSQCSQVDVGETLGISQSAVSSRIKRILPMLRARLSRAGFAELAAAADLEAVLPAVLQAGLRVPETLRGRVLKALESSPRPPGKAMLSLTAAAILALGLTTWLVFASTGGISPISAGMRSGVAGQPLPPREQGQTSLQKSSGRRLVRIWDFNGADSQSDITVRKGKWRWVAGGSPDGSGCMETLTDRLEADLEIPVLQAPLLATFRFSYSSRPAKQGGRAGVFWKQCHWIGQLENVFRSVPLAVNAWAGSKTFVTENGIDVWTDGARSSFTVCSPFSHSKLNLGVVDAKIRIDDLAIFEIPSGELPDSSPYRDAIDRIPPASRTGRVVLPEFPPVTAGQPATALFTGL